LEGLFTLDLDQRPIFEEASVTLGERNLIGRSIHRDPVILNFDVVACLVFELHLDLEVASVCWNLHFFLFLKQTINQISELYFIRVICVLPVHLCLSWQQQLSWAAFF